MSFLLSLVIHDRFTNTLLSGKKAVAKSAMSYLYFITLHMGFKDHFPICQILHKEMRPTTLF